VDVRIIAATNKDLTSEMEKGTFRSDLFYRLSVIPISLPSIRQRPEDIPILLQFFFKQKGQMLAKPIPEIKPRLMKRLLEYNWPGNVRELENTAEKLVLFQGELEMGKGTGTLGEEIEVEQSSFAHNIELKSLLQVEKETIENTLEQLNWNISKAATILGIGRNTLYDKIKKHGIR
jgi:transcriptional regulator with PAS, ATPase and Fis domain